MVLTRRQRKVLDFITDFLSRNGYSPSFQEIADGLSLNSIATVHKHISTLERKGYLKRGHNQSRSLEPGPRYLQELRQQRRVQEGAFSLPLLGRIAAGSPVESLQQAETISLADIARGKDVFVLEVKGDSMIDEHILEGDLILVEKTSTVNNGEIAVALVNGSETTLKRIYRERDGTVRLQPANARMKPILVSAADVAIQGRVVGVLRRY